MIVSVQEFRLCLVESREFEKRGYDNLSDEEKKTYDKLVKDIEEFDRNMFPPLFSCRWN